MFDLDAACVGSNWAVVAAIWSLLPSLIGGEILAVVSIIQVSGMKHSFTKEAVFADVIAPLVIGGPILMLIGSFVSLIVGYFVGLIYGYSITKRL